MLSEGYDIIFGMYIILIGLVSKMVMQKRMQEIEILKRYFVDVYEPVFTAFNNTLKIPQYCYIIRVLEA